MINQEGSLDLAKDAWATPKFLTNQANLLCKRFIFFEQNLGDSHWVSSVMCNPWVSVLLDIK